MTSTPTDRSVGPASKRDGSNTAGPDRPRSELVDEVVDWRDYLRLDNTTIVFATIVVTLLLHQFLRLDFGFTGREWWMAWGIRRFAVYTIIPALVMQFVLGQSVRHHCLARPHRSDFAKYAAMLAVMIPVVLIVANLESFQEKYPYFVASNGLREMWPWWIAYGLQFLGLEFFFRGFIVHSLKGEIGGRAAIAVMMLPYLMIHFGKPLLEAIGSVFAGAILGYLSLKRRSIWLGVAIHVGVAITMDVASLSRQGLL